MKELSLTVREKDGSSRDVRRAVRQVLLAGYTGRDRAKVMEHIHELEPLGVKPPPRVPMIYAVSPDLLTTGDRIEVGTDQTSGEVEFYLLPGGGEWLVGVGSDHTDRAAEAVDIAHSKTLCAKPVSGEVWRYEDVKDHWDRIEIRAWMTEDGERRLYQEGRLDAFMRVEDMLAEVRQAGYANPEDALVFGGTLPTVGGFAFGQRFETELRDPVLDRALTCAYEVAARR